VRSLPEKYGVPFSTVPPSRRAGIWSPPFLVRWCTYYLNRKEGGRARLVAGGLRSLIPAFSLPPFCGRALLFVRGQYFPSSRRGV